MAGALLANTYRGLAAGVEQFGAAVKAVQPALVRMGQTIQEVGKRAAVAFGIATSAVMSFVRAGLEGTVQGQQLRLQWQLLSREIAGLAVPAIRALLHGIQQVTAWFRSLSGEQQAVLVRIVSVGAAFMAASLILPKLIVGVKALGGVLVLLAANPVLAIVTALGALVLSSQEGRSALGHIFDAIRPALRAVGDLFKAIWNLIQPIIEALGKVLPPLVEALLPLFEAVAEVIKTIVGFVTDVVNGIRTVLEELGVIEQRQQRPQRGRQREEVTAVGRGPADVRSFFANFQAAALRTGGGIPERQLRVQEQIERNTRPGGGRQDRPQPPSFELPPPSPFV